MKTILTILAIISMAAAAHAAVLTVDNNINHPTPYQVIDSAIAHASAGDTIYIQGSGSNYGSFTIDKQLTLIGTGANPQKQNPLQSYVSIITLQPAAAGSSVMGLHVNCYQCGTAILCPGGNVDNMTFYGCIFDYNDFPVRGQNWLIRNCLFANQTINAQIQVTSITVDHNVIIVTGLATAVNLSFSSAACVVSNNIFIDNAFGGSAFSNGGNGWDAPTGITVENNIFYGTDPHTCNNCIFNNNISYLGNNNTLPPASCTGANNVSNTDPLFVNFPANGGTAFFNYDCHLQATSPGHNAGTDGTDIGIYGGAIPFVYGMEPAIPQIKSLNIHNTTVPSGGTLQFNAVSKK